MIPITRPVATNISSTPISAPVTYSGFTPRAGIEITRAIQKIRLSTRAEPSPAVASANPASGPATFDNVSSR